MTRTCNLIVEDGQTGEVNKVIYAGVNKGFIIGDRIKSHACIQQAQFLPYYM